MNELEPPYEAIWDLLQSGQIIPFLGAGASYGAFVPGESAGQDPTRLPTASELSRFLARKVNFPPDETSEDLAKVAQYYRVMLGRQGLRQRLHDIFAIDYPFTSIHEFLADIPVPLLIVTTNYDTLIERAFWAREKPFDLVIHPTDEDEMKASVIHWRYGADAPIYVTPRKLQIDLTKTTVIYKMHGSVDKMDAHRDSFVITEDDYIDFLTRVARKTAIPAIFAEPFRNRYFLFIGYSLRDWNFRVVLNQLETEIPKSRAEEIIAWAIQHDPSQLERELWNKRGVRIFNMTHQDFVRKLHGVERQE